MSRLIVLSNRAPSLDGKRDAGGLVVALRDALARQKGLWVGASPDPVAEPAQTLHRHSREDFDVALFDLSPADHEGYYLGYSNSVLWPVFHGRVDLAEFKPGFFEIYRDVAERIARLLSAELAPDDRIWVHDYQMLPVAKALRDLGHENTVGFFLHIPVPPASAFMAIPEHVEVANWLCQYDLVGLQTGRDVSHFVDVMRQVLGGEVLSDGRLSAGQRRFEVGSHPISIDVAEFSRMAEEEAANSEPPHMGRIIGVDRLDYSKGLPQRVEAYDKLLSNNASLRRQVHLLQVAPPSRDSIKEYKETSDTLDAMCGKVMGHFAEPDWQPLTYVKRAYGQPSLAGLFRMARIGLVTPLRDGMNLVAHEYVASQDPRDPGVLVLSRFAGAAEIFDAALLVNPFDTDETAEAMRLALVMPLEERKARWEALFAAAKTYSIDNWAALYLDALSSRKGAGKAKPSDPATLPDAGQIQSFFKDLATVYEAVSAQSPAP